MVNYLTKAEYEHLQGHFNSLKKENEVFSSVNNFDTKSYKEASTEKAFQEERILVRAAVMSKISNILKNFVIVNEGENEGICSIGKEVTLHFEDIDGNVTSEEKYVIGGDWTLEGEISYKSPLGKSILGREQGEEFSYDVNGKEFFGKIISIKNK